MARMPFLDAVLSGEVVLLDKIGGSPIDPIESMRGILALPVWQGEF